MSRYSFTFKKDDIFVEFITEDKEIVERQFQAWVSSADDYVKNHPPKPFVMPSRRDIPEEENKEGLKDVPKEKQIRTKLEQQQIPPTHQEYKSEQITQQSQVFDKASGLLKTINTIQNPDLEKQNPVQNADFEEVLEKKIENSTFEPAKTKDHVFLNLVKSKNTTDKFHYLMITAYYLSEFEKLERFTLKQINAKLMHNLSEVVDHITLQEAINQNFIEIVADLTGMSEADEYRITDAGEEFFANKI